MPATLMRLASTSSSATAAADEMPQGATVPLQDFRLRRAVTPLSRENRVALYIHVNGCTV